MIIATETATGLAYETVKRGVRYYLRRDTLGRLEVTSHRLALHNKYGTVRFFYNMEAVEQGVKAFAGLSAIAEQTQHIAN